MNVLCKWVLLLPDNNPDCDQDNFASCKTASKFINKIIIYVSNYILFNSLSPIRGARLSPNSFSLLPPSSP